MKIFTWLTIIFASIIVALLGIINWFKFVKQVYVNDPWNEYASEEDHAREAYKLQLKEEIIWQDTVRREAHQSDTE